ncbi:MAG: hypothetical protein U9N45_04445 [Gemmatimonadota bacterium]|nr:hypothetical protein [Gemmatimonadota bacterium]
MDEQLLYEKLDKIVASLDNQTRAIDNMTRAVLAHLEYRIAREKVQRSSLMYFAHAPSSEDLIPPFPEDIEEPSARELDEPTSNPDYS